MSRLVDCLRCSRNREHRARGLCKSCFAYESFKGGLDNWPRTTHRLADTAADFLILQGRGMSLAAIAAQLGYPDEHSLAAALAAARRRGHITAAQLPTGLWRARDERRLSGPLTPRERQLLAHYATAARPRPCGTLGIRPATVRAYQSQIRRKLRVATWAEAVQAYVAEAVIAS